jgi:hypothetical protein
VVLPVPLHGIEILNGKRDLLVGTDSQVRVIDGDQIFADEERDPTLELHPIAESEPGPISHVESEGIVPFENKPIPATPIGTIEPIAAIEANLVVQPVLHKRTSWLRTSLAPLPAEDSDETAKKKARIIQEMIGLTEGIFIIAGPMRHRSSTGEAQKPAPEPPKKEEQPLATSRRKKIKIIKRKKKPRDPPETITPPPEPPPRDPKPPHDSPPEPPAAPTFPFAFTFPLNFDFRAVAAPEDELPSPGRMRVSEPHHHAIYEPPPREGSARKHMPGRPRPNAAGKQIVSPPPDPLPLPNPDRVQIPEPPATGIRKPPPHPKSTRGSAPVALQARSIIVRPKQRLSPGTTRWRADPTPLNEEANAPDGDSRRRARSWPCAGWWPSSPGNRKRTAEMTRREYFNGDLLVSKWEAPGGRGVAAGRGRKVKRPRGANANGLGEALTIRRLLKPRPERECRQYVPLGWWIV